MMDCKTRKPLAAALVAMLFAGGYAGLAHAEDGDMESAASKSPMELLFEKISKGFYGTMDVSVDMATKGMSHMLAANCNANPATVTVSGATFATCWSPGGGYVPLSNIKSSPLNTAQVAAPGPGGVFPSTPYPVGNVGWMPQISTNKSGVGFRGDHTLPWHDAKLIYQIEASVSLTAAPGTKTSYTAQSNTVKAGIGYGDSFIGYRSKEWGTLKIGTFYAPYKTSTDRMNPFSGMEGDYAVVMGNSGGDNRVEFGTRLEHSIMYQSPKMYGFSFDALVSPGQNYTYDAVVQSSGSSDCNGGNYPGSGNLPANCDDGGFTSAYSLDLKFETKHFYAVAAYEQHSAVNRNSDGVGSNNPIYGYYFGLAQSTGFNVNPLGLDPTPYAFQPQTSGNTVACGPGGGSSCVVTLPLGAYTTDVATESAGKVGLQYLFDFGLSVSGIFERLRRNVPAYLQFQNERQRNGWWLTATQDLGEATSISAGWAHAGKTPGDPGGQHNYNPFAPADTANMYTVALKEKIDKQVSVYLNWAVTVNHGNAHYDLGAGGRGLTTDCHDGTHTPVIDYSSYGPTTWGGCHIQAVSLGVDYKF